MAEATKSPTIPAKKSKGAKMYWTGALPRLGVFKYKRPSLDQSAIMNDNDEWCTYEDATASRLWKYKNWGIWAGKCKYYQNIAVHGHEFPAFTNRPIVQVDAEKRILTFDPYPGCIVKWTQERYEAIVEATKNTYLREENGKDAENNNSMTAKLLNFELINSSKSKIDQTGTNPRLMDCRDTVLEYDESRDTSVSNFVYIVELDVDASKKSPDDYWTLARMTMEEFFENPPMSLADRILKGAEAKV